MSLSINRLCDELEKTLPLQRVAFESGGKIDPDSFVATSFSTDTRTLEPGAVFVALKGPNHDAHDHAADAVASGASVLVVERELELPVAQIVVENTLAALGSLASIWCQAHQARRVAITGSNGKTTVKEMVAAILRMAALRTAAVTSSAGDPNTAVTATRGNLNNEIGLPLTCLGIRDTHQYAVLEMGASAEGEISYLSQIAKPAVALVNSIAAAHLEGFGSLQAVAREKSSIYSGLAADGVAVMPLELKQHPDYGKILDDASAHCRQVTFGFSAGADIRALASGPQEDVTRVQIDASLASPLAGSEFEVELQLLGQHNRYNALAAIAVCSCFDITINDIVEGLANVDAVPGRLQLRPGVSPARIIDDTYNANPASVRVAIDVLAEFSGKRVLVLGDMKELGPYEMQLHAEAGHYAKSKGIDCLITIGALAAHAAIEFGENAASFTEKKDIAWLLMEKLGPEHTVLFKGSRGARIEEIIDLMLQAQGDSGSTGSGDSAARNASANDAPDGHNSDPHHRTSGKQSAAISTSIANAVSDVASEVSAKAASVAANRATSKAASGMPSQVSQRLLRRVVCL